MIVILSDDKKQSLGNLLFEKLKDCGEKVEYISVSDLDIKTCYGCGSCGTKTYRKCVLEDDMEAVLRKLIQADKMLLVSPLTWGSYSSSIKKILDRSCVLGDIHYYVVSGEIVKGMRSSIKKLYAVGIKDNYSEEEKNVFHKLVHENIKIMNIQGKAFVLNQKDNVDSVVEEICL
jgi:Multimeric flavodoxin WrbA